MYTEIFLTKNISLDILGIIKKLSKSGRMFQIWMKQEMKD